MPSMNTAYTKMSVLCSTIAVTAQNMAKQVNTLHGSIMVLLMSKKSVKIFTTVFSGNETYVVEKIYAIGYLRNIRISPQRRTFAAYSKHQLQFFCLFADYSTLYYPPTVLITNTVKFSCSSSVCVQITVPCTILPPSS
jgi:hypothetical protein